MSEELNVNIINTDRTLTLITILYVHNMLYFENCIVV